MIDLIPPMRRFIPVLTGNTPVTDCQTCISTVYPRTYGEHSLGRLLSRIVGGLSPYLRGTLTQLTQQGRNDRFIPVLTGNTFYRLECRSVRSVYPRTYGEHEASKVAMQAIFGLSPYLRGTLFYQLITIIKSRFIPVLTGNTDGYAT